jgi:hypothetical protein
VRPEGLIQSKTSKIPSGKEQATFRLVAHSVHQMHFRVTQLRSIVLLLSSGSSWRKLLVLKLEGDAIITNAGNNLDNNS